MLSSFFNKFFKSRCVTDCTNSPYWSQYISLNAIWENLFNNQDNSSFVIIFLNSCDLYV